MVETVEYTLRPNTFFGGWAHTPFREWWDDGKRGADSLGYYRDCLHRFAAAHPAAASITLRYHDGTAFMRFVRNA
jgi:hypothetical protein